MSGGMLSIKHDTKRIANMMRGLGDKKVNTIRRRVQGRVARNMANALKFAAPVRSGATKKSIAAKEMKNNNYWIGVRRDYKVMVSEDAPGQCMSKDGTKKLRGMNKIRVEKQPYKYAWLVNRYAMRSGGWFDKVWNLRKGEMAREYIAGMYDEIKKEFNKT